jgi:hypothetical protein
MLLINNAWKGGDIVDHQQMALETQHEGPAPKLERSHHKEIGFKGAEISAFMLQHIQNYYNFTMHAVIMNSVTGIRPNQTLHGRMSSTTLSLLSTRIAPALPLKKFSSISSKPKRFHRTNALDPASLIDTATTTTQAVYELAGVNSATAGTLNTILRPVLSIASLLMIVRIVMTWYPEVDGESMPWLIAVKPTGQSVKFLFLFI